MELASLSERLEGVPLINLVAAAVGVCLLASLVLRVFANALRGKAPPIDEGIPFVGGLIKFSKGPLQLIDEQYKKHGEVFTVPVLHKNVTFLLGPTASPHFYNATDDKMSQAEVYDFNVPTFGKGVVYDVDQKIRSEQFRFVAEALRTSKLRTYVPAFQQEAEEHFSKWGESGTVDLMEVFSELIILTASRTLLGREVREQMFTEVASYYHDLDDGMRPISVFFPYLPTPFHFKRDRAREAMGRIFGRIIAARRANNTKEDDILQVLIDSRYRNAYGGRAMNDSEITGLLIAILFAGQHTSSVTATWTGLRMIANPQYYKAAEEEQRRTLLKYGASIDMDVLNSLDSLHLNIQEALRLDPPLIMLMRLCKEPFSVNTSDGRSYVVPRGHIVATSPTYSHKLSSVFKEADRYQPERYLPPRDEDKAQPYSFVGFGGGRHGCMGQQFAYLQIKTIWSVLLRNFEFELVDPFPEPDYTSMVIMPKPCRVRYTRRKL